MTISRAIAEMRAGRPVILAGESLALVACAESVDAELSAFLSARSMPAYLVLPAPRLRRLGLAERSEAGAVPLAGLDPQAIATLVFATEADLDRPVAPATSLDESALDLARVALMLPACLVVPLADPADAPADLLTVQASSIAAYRGAGVRQVSRAPVPLEGARDSEFVVFRGGDGLREHVAILVGRPDPGAPVAVRLHSACLTGDLFGSLKCDCGDQLRGAVGDLAQSGGGIVLYLDQEGRGNGLANKIRAYDLQACGFDTFEADEILGYGLDQRRYDFAATMLRHLGISRVRLLSNNPAKVAALRAEGLEVVGSQPSLGRVTAENLRYLTMKRDRTGHALGGDIAARLDAQAVDLTQKAEQV
ncbi:GTP cyclohydrolase II RibA [Methylobacterium sp. NEAU K]|uniref:GTP cyclohydrolase II RibA n=1 Tax=Methylobacterium sp. NEAU K TaxID=3064946 RepID=UPI002733ADA7|nr:GTP cyclohydrolase II RibA [Methylobacterium sp. NEAU K]MDP4006174.1 GTP cyclohydrolase II RibA [Methylobacterium sp. NEAU K]